MMRRASITFLLIVCLMGVGLFAYNVHREYNYFQGATYGANRAVNTIARELHRRDFLANPILLNLLVVVPTSETNEVFEYSGVMYHSIVPDQLYEYDDNYHEFLEKVVDKYNYITLGQVCYLVLQGEDSDRVRSVLSFTREQYLPSMEGALLEFLPAAVGGSESARALFAETYTRVFGGEFINSVNSHAHYTRNTILTNSAWKTRMGPDAQP